MLCAIGLFMIRSQKKCFGFWFTLTAFAVFLLSAILVVLQFQLEFFLLHYSENGKSPYLIWLMLHGVVVLFFGYRLWYNCPNIYVDFESMEKSVSIKNMFTGFQRKYYFGELDGYSTKKIAHINLTTYYNVVCLVRKGRV